VEANIKRRLNSPSFTFSKNKETLKKFVNPGPGQYDDPTLNLKVKNPSCRIGSAKKVSSFIS